MVINPIIVNSSGGADGITTFFGFLTIQLFGDPNWTLLSNIQYSFDNGVTWSSPTARQQQIPLPLSGGGGNIKIKCTDSLSDSKWCVTKLIEGQDAVTGPTITSEVKSRDGTVSIAVPYEYEGDYAVIVFYAHTEHN